MIKMKITLNGNGVRELLKSREMQMLLEDCAKKISGNEGETEVYIAKTRAVAEITGDDGNNRLLKAVGKS